jgi:deoxyhypusine synthase
MTEDDGTGEHHPPERGTFDNDPIDHAQVETGMTVGELVDAYGDAGIGAADLHEAVDVYAEMLADDVSVFLGLAGAMVPTGMRGIVTEMVREGHVDALVTTGANLTRDAIEAVGGKHHHGSSGPGDHRSVEATEVTAETLREHDETLRDEQVDRIYKAYLPQEHFALFEDHLRSAVFPELGRANAEVNEREGVAEDPGVAAAAYENDVPVYCPAIQDSVLGLQA